MLLIILQKTFQTAKWSRVSVEIVLALSRSMDHPAIECVIPFSTNKKKPIEMFLHAVVIPQ